MPRWYMEEMDIAYDLVELSLAQGQNLKEDFLSINPFGKLPAMKDDSVVDAKGDEGRWGHHSFRCCFARAPRQSKGGP